MDQSAWEKKIAEVTSPRLEGSDARRHRRGRPPKSATAEPAAELAAESLASPVLGGISPAAVIAAGKGSQSLFVEVNAEIAEALKCPPKAFIEPEGPRPYLADIVDGLLPKPGFITDFVNTGRGVESPTFFFVWNALWLLSTILKREAWLRWYPGQLWPNLYVIIVAPPALCRKGSSMKFADNLLRSLPAYLPTTLDAYKKETRIVTGKTTPEGLLLSLEPQERTFFQTSDDPTTGPKMISVKKGSQAAIAIGEFAVFLGKQQYNTGMVNLLTDLFDCKDFDSEITRGRGDKPLEDIYVTLFGAITPDGLKMSIPEEAFGGGFMSRVLIAYQGIPTKIYSIPRKLVGYPVWEDLRLKLAWIAMNAIGEYTLTPEAEEYYDKWYHKWKGDMFSRGYDASDENRVDSLILRVALLMRAQEYREGRDITVDNIIDAKKLVEYTVATGKQATEDVGTSIYTVHLNAVRRALIKRAQMTRRELSQFMSSRGATAKELSEIVEQLSIEGFLRIKLGDTVLERSIGTGKEVYELIEGRV